MKTSTPLVLIPALVVWLASSSLVAQTYETEIVTGAGNVLNEIMAIPAWQIPASLLADAQGIVIIPNMVKGGFVVGVRHGRGIAVLRDERGDWGLPMFVTVTGGSVGWQVGLQAIDLILVFKTRNSVQRLVQGKFTIGADAAAAAGPVGRQAAAATDLALRAEILSYSRSRGLFAGVAIDGSVLQVDLNANAIYYASTGGAPQPGQAPPSAARLLEQLAAYTATPAVAPMPGPADDAQSLRRQLAQASQQLQTLLGAHWQQYLALPAEVYLDGGRPSPEALAQALARYDQVWTNPQYQNLTRRPEFQTTYGLLKTSLTLQAARTSPTLSLPPPPR